ncbi:MAG TPA: hypothetical protein VKT32_06755 [Chthonomonadaceae bacterium]|nr:hypothetical protein [Chthonomonadaceae bacterium]
MIFRGEYYSIDWAYQQRGWYIDDQGNIYSYDYTDPKSHEALTGVRPYPSRCPGGEAQAHSRRG